MIELKPCPFCGGTDLTPKPDWDSSYVACRDCWCSGPDGDGDTGEAKQRWNTRRDPLRQQLEVLVMKWREDAAQEEYERRQLRKFGDYFGDYFDGKSFARAVRSRECADALEAALREVEGER